MKVRQELTAREVDELHQSLSRRLGDTSVPTLPQVAVKIVELIGNPNATLNQFASVIQSDQALTGRLLRLANSAMFAQRQPVTTLQRAMVLMGLDKLKAISLGFHLSKVMVADDGPLSLKRLWTQSLYRAWLALHLAEVLDKKVSGEAFIVGMLADCGMSAMMKLTGDQYLAVVNPKDPPSRQFLSELRGLELTHVDASMVLCRMWKLPALLAKPIALHHTPAQSVSRLDPASILHAVAYYVGTLPLDGDASPLGDIHLPQVAERLFELDAEGVGAVLRTAANSFKATRELFAHMIDSQLSVDAIVATANRYTIDSDGDEVAKAEAASDAPPQAGRSPGVGALRAAGMIFEFERAKDRLVTAIISDADGNRLFSEEIDTRKHDDQSIRQLLLLDDANPRDAEQVLRRIKNLAA